MSFLLKDYILALIPCVFLVLLNIFDYPTLLIDRRSRYELVFDYSIKHRLKFKQWIIAPIFWILEIIALIANFFENSHISLMIPDYWLDAIICSSYFQMTIMTILFILTPIYMLILSSSIKK